MFPAYPGPPPVKPADTALDRIERALWFGRPDRALAGLDELAGPTGTARDRAGWLRGVALLAAGRFAAAAEALRPVLPVPGAPPDRYRSLAASAAGSVARQQRRYAEAAGLDGLALFAAGDARDARADALVGLTADAIGRAEPAAAADRLAELDALLDRPDPWTGPAGPWEWWRPLVRRHWVGCELALLTDRPQAAAVAAGHALRWAEWIQSPRHIAKSLLFLGVSTRESSRHGNKVLGFWSAVAILGRAECVATSIAAHLLRLTAGRLRREASLEAARAPGSKQCGVARNTSGETDTAS